MCPCDPHWARRQCARAFYSLARADNAASTHVYLHFVLGIIIMLGISSELTTVVLNHVFKFLELFDLNNLT